MATQPVPRRLLSTRELAIAFRVAENRISKWRAEGMPVAVRGRGRGRECKYDLAKVIEWRVQQRLLQAGPGGPGLDLVTERARLTKAQTARALMDIASKRRELVPAAEVRQVFGDCVSAVRSAALSIPQASAERVTAAAGEGGAPAIEAILKAFIDDALRPLESWPGTLLQKPDDDA